MRKSFKGQYTIKVRTTTCYGCAYIYIYIYIYIYYMQCNIVVSTYLPICIYVCLYTYMYVYVSVYSSIAHFRSSPHSAPQRWAIDFFVGFRLLLKTCEDAPLQQRSETVV